MNQVTRREFLHTSAESTASLAIGAACLSTQLAHAANDSPNERIVLALIGAGGRGSSHASAMAALPNVQFKYVCDVWDERGRRSHRGAGKNSGTPSRTDPRYATGV